jgi:hypothetical protein
MMLRRNKVGGQNFLEAHALTDIASMDLMMRRSVLKVLSRACSASGCAEMAMPLHGRTLQSWNHQP